MDLNDFLSSDDLAGVLDQLKEMPDIKEEPTQEELASQKRYEEIIKKHAANQAKKP